MRVERARCDEISSCPKLLLSAALYLMAVSAGLEIERQQVATAKFFFFRHSNLFKRKISRAFLIIPRLASTSTSAGAGLRD